LKWPDDARREVISTAIGEEFGFEGCIGLCDGTLIRLSEEPEVDGHVYYCRKKYYAINMQATVDHEKRFTSFELGFPGSTTDITMFKNSSIWQLRPVHFKDGQFLIADKGYTSSPYLLRPFGEDELTNIPAEIARRRQFNKHLSSLRVRVEHAFGLLKGRFPSLKELGVGAGIDGCYRAVHAMLVVHNLCIDLGDAADRIGNFNPRDDFDLLDTVDEQGDLDLDEDGYQAHDGDDIFIDPWETSVFLKQMGYEMRLDFLNLLFPV